MNDSSQDSVIRSLKQIEAGLERLDRKVLSSALQPGVSRDLSRSLLHLAGLTVHADLVTLYEWHNGTAGDGLLGDLWLFPGFYLLSLEEATANYDAFVSDPRWNAEWLPVFADGGGDFYVVEAADASSSPVRRFRIDESEHPIEYRSLAEMLATIAEAYTRRIYFVDAEGYLELNQSEYNALALRMNPLVDWWH